MKPVTKGFMIGLIVGGLITLVVEIVGLTALGVLMSSGIGRSWMADRVLRPPEFPQTVDASLPRRVNYEWTLRTLGDESISFETFRGKTVFLNIWATWCAPCGMEMPNIERLSRSMADSDVAFVIVSLEDEDVVRSYAERNSLNLPLYVADELPEEFEGDTLPSTFIINPDGNLVFQHTGASMWDDDRSREFLRSLSR